VATVDIVYSSSIVDTSDIQGFAPEEYLIEVDPKGDHVEAWVQKITLDTNEIKVELYYKGEIEDIESTKIPLLPIKVECDID